jgi:hypothetical protein
MAISRLNGVLLDVDDAAYLAETLKQDFAALAGVGIRPSERVTELQRKLVKAVANASESSRDTHVDVRLIGEQPDSAHTALYDLVDSGEAARILGCTPANVRDLGRRGQIPRHRAGRGWVYPATAVVARAERRAANRG